jgi:hypothetical protein
MNVGMRARNTDINIPLYTNAFLANFGVTFFFNEYIIGRYKKELVIIMGNVNR